MDPEPPSTPPHQALPPLPTPPTAPPKKQLLPHKKLLLLVIFAVLGLGTMYIGIYYTLDKELAQVTHRDQVIPTPTTSQDPTSDWKTYNNTSFNFQLQYPADWNVNTSTNDSVITLSNKNTSLTVFENGSRGFDGPNEKKILKVGTENKQFSYYKFDDNTIAYNGGDISNLSTHKTLGFLAKIPTAFEAENTNILKEILSTFKFTNSSTPSPTISKSPDDQVMCTMDAKLCPDGSSVGRTGPNCEFTPCPE